MDIGRVLLGTSTVAALVLAAGFGVAVAPVAELTSDAEGSVCMQLPEGTTTASTWFEATMRNDTDVPVRVRSVRADHLENVRLERLSIAPHPREFAPGLIGTDDGTLPPEYGRVVPVDSGAVVPAHGQVAFVGRITLVDATRTGAVRGFTVTSTGVVGSVREASTAVTFGLAVAQPGSEDDGCARV